MHVYNSQNLLITSNELNIFGGRHCDCDMIFSLTCVYPLLDNAGLRLAVMHLVGLALLHVLQLQPEGVYVVLALQQKDPSALVQAGGFTDPHATLAIAPHTWSQSQRHTS